MFNNNFWNNVPRFCEHYFWNDGKEYMNTLSALFISGLGLYGLYNNSPSFLINLLYSFLILNGIFSSLNHWYEVEGWSYADGATMLLPVTLGIILISNMYFDYFKIKGTLNIIRYIIYPILIFIPLFLQIYTNYFIQTFLFLSLLLFSFIPVVLKIGKNKNMNFSKEIKLFLKGAGLVIIAAGFWFYTEPICLSKVSNPNLIKFYSKLFFHVIWHILSALGFYFMIDSFDNFLKVIYK